MMITHDESLEEATLMAEMLEQLAYKLYPLGAWSEDEDAREDYHKLMNARAFIIHSVRNKQTI